MSLRLLVRVLALAALLVLADVAYAPRAHRRQVSALSEIPPDTTSYMRAAAGDGHPVRVHAWVPLFGIAPVAACTVVLAEDELFFESGTVDWQAQRALVRRLLRGDLSRGGSGISQQLARNLFLVPDRTPRRKAREYVLAYELSHTLPKERILELYLNLVEWGDGVWGIEAASRHYFGVGAEALTAPQAVVLATILPAPRRELQYALGRDASRRQEGIVRKLWRARLLSDTDVRETLDRIRAWRARARATGDGRSAWAGVDELMGPAPASFTASTRTPGALPLARLCDPRRRGT